MMLAVSCEEPQLACELACGCGWRLFVWYGKPRDDPVGYISATELQVFTAQTCRDVSA